MTPKERFQYWECRENLAYDVCLKSVRYIKMSYPPRVQATDFNNWDLENIVTETERFFFNRFALATGRNYPKLWKTMECLEKQQHELIPEEYSQYKKSCQ